MYKLGKKKFWLILVGVLFLGMILSPRGKKEVIKKEPCDYSNWKELKEIDDEGFKYCADFMYLCSDGFVAAADFDISKLEKVQADMEELAPKISRVGNERQEVMEELGY